MAIFKLLSCSLSFISRSVDSTASCSASGVSGIVSSEDILGDLERKDVGVDGMEEALEIVLCPDVNDEA
jgi:hypothetical protein